MLHLAKFIFLIFLTGCAAGVGKQGSNVWFMTSSDSEKIKYFDERKDHELCILWATAIDHPSYRIAIANALERRNQDPLKCNDPKADAAMLQRNSLKSISDRNVGITNNAIDERIRQNRTQQQIMNHGAGGCTPNFATGGCL